MCDTVDNMNEAQALLKRNGLRATPKRLKLIEILSKSAKPLTAEDLHAKARGIDLVTVYRNLQSLVAAGLVREVRFKDASVRYESAESGHHHHLVCTDCGTIDELPGCDIEMLEKQALRKSGKFARIEEHALEFFGTCRACA